MGEANGQTTINGFSELEHASDRLAEQHERRHSRERISDGEREPPAPKNKSHDAPTRIKRQAIHRTRATKIVLDCPYCGARNCVSNDLERRVNLVICDRLVGGCNRKFVVELDRVILSTTKKVEGEG